MTRSCPRCSSLIPASAESCNYCGETIAGVKRTTAAPQPDPETKLCPECAEEIKYAAKVCRFCGYRLAPAEKSYGSVISPAPGERLMRAGQALDNAGKTMNSIVGSIILILIIVFLYKACGG